MSVIPVSAADARLERLYEVAQEYRARDYRVIVGPSEGELPEFLHGYRPDLLAMSEHDRAVVEVKQRRALTRGDAFARMAEVIERQPGWRLELVLVPAEDQPEEPLPDSADLGRVRTLLEQAEEFRDAGIAIVPAVAALEHAMLIAAARAGIQLPSRSPNAALKTLFAHGLLSKPAYDELSAAIEVRNDVAHGKRTDVDARPWLAKVVPIVEELIAAA